MAGATHNPSPPATPASVGSGEIEAGSFRDRQGRIFYRDGAVFRGLSARAVPHWKALAGTRFFSTSVANGKLISTREVAPTGLDAGSGAWATVLEHQRVPFVSYPYEWSFSMLKDAARLQLELHQAALDEDMTMKDASPYNVQWTGAMPTFIDILSFERMAAGEPWTGYRQFCQLFLYPLLLQAYKGIPFQPWLRGHLDGIEPEQCSALMSLRDLLRPGVLTHVYLQARASRRYAQTQQDIKGELRAAGFNKALIQANLRGLARLVGGLSWDAAQSEWSHYAENNPYSAADHERKAAFVRRAAGTQRWKLVWDLGCNTGTFSRLAAEHADCVVAMDADQLAVERLYRALAAEGNQKILPLVSNVADASPNLGWRGLERKALAARGAPDLTLCLALIHHLVLSANIPLDEFVAWLASLGTALVIEFVTKDDPMVRTLLRNKADIYDDYGMEIFERRLRADFDVEWREPLACETRILYFARPKRHGA